MDKPLGKKSGEITIDVHLNGLDEQLTKAHELVETIEKARSLTDDLAKVSTQFSLSFKSISPPMRAGPPHAPPAAAYTRTPGRSEEWRST